MRKGFFNKKWYMSIVSLLFVAIIPLCSINLYNYSQVLSTTSQEETLDDEQNNVGEGIDTSENNDDDEATTQASGYWTDYATRPTISGSSYIIDSATDLAWMANQSSLTRTYNLTANINLEDHYWVPIMNFAGTFNGNGYTIKGMTIDQDQRLMIQRLKDGSISITTLFTNLEPPPQKLLNSFSYPGIQTFGLFGYINNSCVIDNVIVEGSIDLNFTLAYDTTHSYYKIHVGGIVGCVSLGSSPTFEIRNCVNKVSIDVDLYSNIPGVESPEFSGAVVGGIVGSIGENVYGNIVEEGITIENCINLGTIDVSIDREDRALLNNQSTGGIVGWLRCGYVNKCINYIVINSNNAYTGGIVGRAEGRGVKDDKNNPGKYTSIEFCLNYGDVHGLTDAGSWNAAATGGIVGETDNWSLIYRCINFASVYGHTGTGRGQIIGRIGGYGAQINYCYASTNISSNDSVSYWLGMYDNSVRGNWFFGYPNDNTDYNFGDREGIAQQNETYRGDFDDYMNFFGDLNYGDVHLLRAYTGIEFRSDDVTDDVCQNSVKPVTLSSFVRDMYIEVKTWDSNCNLVNFTGNNFYLDSANNGLDMSLSWSYNFYSTITMDYFSAFKMANNGRYTVTVYEKDTSKENNLGRRIMGPRTDTSIEYALTGSDLNQGTYSGNFTDIIIVLELAQDPPPPPGIEIYTSDCLYDGNGYTIKGLKLCSKGGTVEMNYDTNIGTCTPNGKVAVSKNDVSTADTIVTLRITANPGYEFIGLFADEDLENEEIPIASRRIERFNDITYDEYLDDIPEEDIENLPNIPAKRVDVETSDGYRIYEYTLDYSALITGMNIVPVGEESASGQDEVSANRSDNLVHVTIIGGSGGGGGGSTYDDQKQEDENKEEEEKFKYIVESISYVKSLDVAFVAYRQDYNLDVTYQGSGAEPFSLEKGYEKRELYAERGHNPTQHFFNAGTTDKVTSLKLDYGSKYFFNSAFVEYVADVSGAVEGYWSSGYGSSVRGMTFKDTYVELSLWEFFANVKMSAMCDPLPDTEIVFKYCESPRYDYIYTIYITDAYEEYCTGQYLPGQLVGETDYYGYTMISKENISVDLPSGELVSLPATKIPVGATYREVFDFNRNNILSSDFISGLVDTSKIIEYPYTNVGGISFTINYTLSEVARRYEKEPITGYKEEDGYCLSDDYSDTNTTMLANTTLRDIINMFGDLSEDECSVTLYSFFHLRDPYKIEFQTMVDGEPVTLSMPANSDEYILTANDTNMTSNSLEFTCEPFDLIDVDVTDKLVYRYDGQKTTFYSFDCMTVGDSVLSESGTYSFQGIPTNDIEEFVIAVNFKEEFTVDNRILNSDTSISYNSSIWYVDSATDLLNIAYRVYCQGLPLAKKIVQTADIDFEGGYMLPIGTESQPFSSVYDGQYYRIENMSIVGGTADDIGLFGYAVGATIKNLTLMNADVSGGYNVGAVAGYATSTTFERVGSYNGIVSAMDVQTAGRGIFLTNGVTAVNVTKQNGTYTSISLGNNGTSYTVLSVMVADEIVNDSDRAYYIGDLIGRGDNVTIKICFVRKSNTINAEIGGFAGLLENSQVTNAYTSRSDFGNTIGTTLTHTHTDITDISTCPDCDDVFIW